MENGCREKECQIKLSQALLPRVDGERMEMVQSLSLKHRVLADGLQCAVVQCGWSQTAFAGWCIGEVQWHFPMLGQAAAVSTKACEASLALGTGAWALCFVLLTCRSLLGVCRVVVSSAVAP